MTFTYRRVAIGSLLLAALAFACGGGASSSPSDPGDGGSKTQDDGAAPDGAAEAAAEKAARCKAIEDDYDGIATTPSYRTCTSKTDCQLLGDICVSSTDGTGVNKAGIDRSSGLWKDYRGAGCGPFDCGSSSGGGDPPSADCQGGWCVTRYVDGGVRD